MEESVINLIERFLRLLHWDSYAHRWYERGYTHGKENSDKDMKSLCKKMKHISTELRRRNDSLNDENRRIRERFVSTFSEDLRQQVFSKSKWRCEYCGKRKDLTVDHFIPISKGGGSNIENLVAAYRDCNKRKLKKSRSCYS